MEFDLDKGLAVLTRTPATLRELLAGLPSPWTSANEGRDTWSPQDVVGHLIHGEETDWIPRAQIILTKGEAQPFEPFDRFAQARRFADWSLQRLLDRFAELRAEGVATVRQWHLSREQLALRGRHPELGQVTLCQPNRDSDPPRVDRAGLRAAHRPESHGRVAPGMCRNPERQAAQKGRAVQGTVRSAHDRI